MSNFQKALLALLACFIVACGNSNNDFVLTNTSNPTAAVIQVTPGSSTIAVGTSQALTATLFFTNGSSSNVTDQVTWTSSDSTVASVTATGVVTGVAAGGPVAITATLNGLTASASVTVSGATLSGLTVTPQDATTPAGTSVQFRALANFSDGTSQDVTSQATWTTGDNAVATVDDLGRATGVAAGGPVTITAAFGGFADSGNLTVSGATLLSIAVTSQFPSVPLGFTSQMTATGTYSDGSVLDITNDVTWASADTDVSIDQTGLATGDAVGSSQITASLDGVTGSFVLGVSDASLVSLALSPTAPYNIGVGSSIQLSAIGTFSDGSTLDLTSQTNFLSPDTGIATVNNNNPTKGILTGVSTGTVTIAAATVGGIGTTAEVNVSVPAALQAEIFVVDNANNLISFNSQTPGTTNTVAITGIGMNQVIEGIDFRPSNGNLYALAHDTTTGTVQLYTLNTGSGVATMVGAAVAGMIPVGTRFGFDINPLADAVRVTTSGGLNLRLNANDGTLIMMDGATTGSDGVTGQTGAAYTNNQVAPMFTTLYSLDATANSLYRVNPPNLGTLVGQINVTVNGSILDFSSSNGFDILPGVDVTGMSGNAVISGSALAALTFGGQGRLYAIDLVSGAANNLGQIGALTEVRAMAARNLP